LTKRNDYWIKLLQIPETGDIIVSERNLARFQVDQYLRSGGFLMAFEDKTLICRDCGNEFIFTAGEQEFFAEKGFENEPQRCKDCRVARRASRNSGRSREMFTVICAACGAEAQVPFQPKDDRPVYCRDCFESRR
jgi:CxxC-x17-CxxC domain-containing protein